MESRLLGKKLSMPLQIVIWLFSFYIAWNLIPSGYGKVMSPEQSLPFFEQLGLGAGILMAVGIVEVVGPVLNFIPRVSFYGALPTFVVMVGASYYSGGNSTALTAAFLSLLIMVLTRPQFLRKQPKITTVQV